MEGRGFSRVLIIPVLAAVAIVVILFWLPEDLWKRSAISVSQVSRHSLPSTRASESPWTLTDEERRHGTWTPSAASIPQRYNETTDPEFVSRFHETVPRPRDPVAVAALAAPIVTEEVDLAGLHWQDFSTVRTVSSKSNKSDSSDAQLVRQRRESSTNSWPATPDLDDRLASLSHSPVIGSWATEVQTALQTLRTHYRVGDPAAGAIIQQLNALVAQGIQIAETSTEAWSVRSEWLRAVYSLERRIQVWTAVAESRTADPFQFVANTRDRLESVDDTLRDLRTFTLQTQDPTGWANYLLLDQVEQAVQSPVQENRQLVAQRVLSRLNYYRLNDGQRELMQADAVQKFAASIRPWAATPVNIVELLEQIEAYELNPDDARAAELATAIQSLRYSEQPEIALIAARLNDHYRNANLRVSISAEMLQRMLPKPEPKTKPVRQQILGADVRGTSWTETDLSVRLMPTQNAWHLVLTTNGNTATQTISKNGPARLRHQGNANFQAETEIRIDQQGMMINHPQVDVRSSNRLRSIASDYDALPIIGPMVRSIALARHDELRCEAQAISQNITKREVSQAIDQELQKSASEAEHKFVDRLVGPLAGMNLHPLVVDLQTTEQRMTVRYRVAGNYQLAASSPRPRAWSDSVLSMQVHESTLNNLMEQSLPSEKLLPISELWQRAAGPFGKDPPSDLPDNVRIMFAETRPIDLRFINNRFELQLNIAALQVDDRLFRNFSVKVNYRPEVQGMSAKLVRDGTPQISGERLGTRDRIPIRVIFSKVFSENRALPLVAEELAQTHDSPTCGSRSSKRVKVGWLSHCRDNTAGQGACTLPLHSSFCPKALSGRVER